MHTGTEAQRQAKIAVELERLKLVRVCLKDEPEIAREQLQHVLEHLPGLLGVVD